MKKQRALFVGCITVFFMVCYIFMTQRYDPLARYPYATPQNRDKILAAVSKADIQILVDYDIFPEEFLPFVKIDGFNLRNSKAYYAASLVKDDTKKEIVSSVNTILEYMSMETMLLYLDDYSFAEIVDWVENRDMYNAQSIFIYHPTNYDAILNERYTVARYVPKDLEFVSAMHALISNGQILLREEANVSLGKMCSLMQDSFAETCGGLIATQGYMSYEEQLEVYDEYLLKYGDEVHEYFLFPGHNEWQLGNSIEVTLKDDESLAGSEQYRWLKKHAAEFGFVLRYPNSNVLRYVGKDLAQYLVENDMTLEDVWVSK